MSPLEQLESESHRVIITRRRGSEILRVSSRSGWSLPCVEILSKHRVADQLTERVQKERGLRAYCILNMVRSESDRSILERRYAVMEATETDENAPDGCEWFPVPQDDSRFVDSIEDGVAIIDALRETRPGSAAVRPFSRFGWMDELLAWVQGEISSLDLELTGTIHQLNASPTFSLIRLETTGPAIWFKATGEPNRHELRVSVALSRLFPRFVPEILAVHPSWNGWLSEEASGTQLGDLKEPSSWERVAGALAELQVNSAGKCTELVDSGCKDIRLPKVIKLIDPFLSRMSDFMAAQAKRPPEPLTNQNLALLGERLKRTCSLLDTFGLPETLGHIDFNPGNIIVSSTGCCFLDWAEGCVAPPLVTFEYLKEHSRRAFPRDEATTERIVAAYLRPWQSLISADTIRLAMMSSPVIAILVAAIADSTWLSVDPLQDPEVAGYFRSLTRRMFRESTGIADEIRA
jgi:phosphotransferase family enzyme